MSFLKGAGDSLKTAGLGAVKAGGAELVKNLMTSEMLAGIFATFASKSTGLMNGDGLKGAIGKVGEKLEWGADKTKEKTEEVVDKAEKSFGNIDQITLDQFTNLMQADD